MMQTRFGELRNAHTTWALQAGKIFLMENLLTSWFNQIKCTSHNLAKGRQCEVTPTQKSSHKTVMWSWVQQQEDVAWGWLRFRNQIKLKSSHFSIPTTRPLYHFSARFCTISYRLFALAFCLCLYVCLYYFFLSGEWYIFLCQVKKCVHIIIADLWNKKLFCHHQYFHVPFLFFSTSCTGFFSHSSMFRLASPKWLWTPSLFLFNAHRINGVHRISSWKSIVRISLLLHIYCVYLLVFVLRNTHLLITLQWMCIRFWLCYSVHCTLYLRNWCAFLCFVSFAAYLLRPSLYSPLSFVFFP